VSDVARKAGVSRATAARALGDYGSVSDSTKESVRKAAADLGYSPNSIARSMVTGKTRTFGALVADVANPFFAKLMRGFSDGVRKEGYNVILMNTDESVSSEVNALGVLIGKRVDGLLVAPASADRYEHLQSALDHGQLIVQVDRFIPELETDVVVVDNYEASYLAVSRVINAGHTRIAAPLLRSTGADGHFNIVSTMDDRTRGYLNAMSDAGLEVPRGYQPPGRQRSEVAQAVGGLLRRADRPTALFGADDTFMLGIIDAVRSEKLGIPEDISVFGFDDTEWTTVVTPPLSVISQPAYDLGLRSAQVLLQRLKSPYAEAQSHILPTSWVERDSIAPIA
jgi:LacI family transcriptional regulator